MALCMLLSLCVMSIHFMFDAIAYQFYLPMIAGLSTILINSSKPLIEEAEARVAGTAIPAGSGSPAAGTEMALAGTGTDAQNPKMRSGPLQTGRPPIPRSQNPYRFGRRRVDS